MAHSTASNGRPETSRRNRRHLGAYRGLSSPQSQYKFLLARLRKIGFGPGGSLQSVGLTSSGRHEGVTTVACNLALYAASCQDFRVLLIDANHSNPVLHRIFQLQQTPGLTDLINGDAAASDCIQDMSSRPLDSWPSALKQSLRRGRGLSRLVGWRGKDTPAPQLSVMPAGNREPGMRSRYISENDDLLDRTGTPFDLVVVDLPATSSTTDCGFKLSKLDGVLVVLEAETTSDITAQKSLDLIREDGANLLGIAFNKCRTHLPKWIDKKLG